MEGLYEDESLPSDERQAYKAISTALALEDGDEKIAAMEEAVRLADRTGDLWVQYFARDRYVDVTFWGGSPEKTLVAFSWMLAQFDRNPGRFDEHSLLWTYKWIVSTISHFPQISKAQIYEMLEDMSRRYASAGRGLRVVHQHRYRIEKFWGERDEALKFYRLAEDMPSDDLSNCPACEIDERVSFQLYMGNDARALDLARPLLAGEKRCRTVPHRTLANLMIPLLRLGRRREAWQFHLRGYRLIEGQKGLVTYASDHLLFLALAGRHERGREVFEKHLQWAQDGKDLFKRYEFYRAAWLFFELAPEPAADARLQLSLPSTFALHAASGLYDRRQLAAWFERDARRIAALFDARNGNDHFTRELDETPSLKKLCLPAA